MGVSKNCGPENRPPMFYDPYQKDSRKGRPIFGTSHIVPNDHLNSKPALYQSQTPTKEPHNFLTQWPPIVGISQRSCPTPGIGRTSTGSQKSYGSFCKTWGSFKGDLGRLRASLKGFGGWHKAGLELILTRTRWLFLEIGDPFRGCPFNKSHTMLESILGPLVFGKLPYPHPQPRHPEW